MLAEFFQLTPIPSDAMTGLYDLRLVILSYVVATFASYIALDFTGRLRDVGNTSLSTLLWILGGAFAMGAGIWSMHFIGMLAFTMPDMPMMYEPFWTGLSMLVAILASAFALILLKVKVLRIIHFLLGGIILGFGIASMHYVGMQAMKITANIHYIPSLFILSIVIAILASLAALWLALKSNQVVNHMRLRLKVISAFIMGAAICGMHYTGMVAAVFTPLNHPMVMSGTLNPELLSGAVAGVTFLILGVAFFASTYKEALNQQLLATARQAGMAEVAASVLHNVGNVLNSVNVSAILVSEKVDQSKLAELASVSQLLDKHTQDLGHFITKDPQGSQLPEYLKMLAVHGQNEQEQIKNEMNILIKNVEHIKNIIAMQQGLSRTTNIPQIHDIEDILDEALMITGFNYERDGITIEKKYQNISPIIIDKIKVLQILVNLVRNAKDSLLSSPQAIRKITLVIEKNNNKLKIHVIDTGEGIARNNLIKIFGYGFTTKKEGHGFGLHSSALSAKEMGGSLIAESEGLKKGAIFILELPYNLPRK